MSSTNMTDVRDFLSQRRIAFVGLSRTSGDFSRSLFREMCGRGYDMVPVNPAATELEGRQCFRRVQEVTPPVDAALIMTSPRDTERVVQDCAEAGIGRVWMHRGGGQGSVDEKAVEFCRQKSIRLVEGECPFMFFSGTQFFHRAHGFLRKMTGSYPR